VARFNPTDVLSSYASISALNANFNKISELFDKAVILDGEPITVSSDFDIGHFRVRNVGDAVHTGDAINLGQLISYGVSGVDSDVITGMLDGKIDSSATVPDGSALEAKLKKTGISPSDPPFNAAGDGITDDTTAVATALSYAFTNGLPVEGGSEVFAVSGSLQFSMETSPYIRSLRLKQLAPTTGTKLLYLVNCQKIRIDSLEVDCGTNMTTGYMNDSGGLWIDGGSNHKVSNVTAFGHGKNSLITIMNTSYSQYTNLHVRDAQFSDAAATDDVMQGIFMLYNSSCQVITPRVENLDGNASYLGVELANLRTRGIALGGNDRILFVGPQIRFVDQGMDISGGETNTAITIIGGQAEDCTSVGFKFANTAKDCIVSGAVARRCGLYGFLASGPVAATTDAVYTENITFANCLAVDTGFNNFPSTSYAFQVQVGNGATGSLLNYPQGVRIIGCKATDTQAVRTMDYGFWNNAPFVSATKQRVELIDSTSVGHITAAQVGFHRPICRLSGSGSVSIGTSGVEQSVGWDVEVDDSMGMHSAVSDTDQINVPISGRYRVRAKVVFATNSSGYRRVKITKNNTSVVYVAVAPVSGEVTTVLLNEEMDLLAGDFLKAMVEQTSGGALNAIISQSYFDVELIREA